MRISTKGRYGLKAMFDLAMNYSDQPTPLSAIASRQQISLNYLEQIMTRLRRAGLIASIRGAQGGYYLTKDPGKITIGEVLTALVGSLAPTDCLEGKFKDPDFYCVSRVVYSKIYEGILSVVDNISLADMCEDHAKNSFISEISDLTCTDCSTI